jgi:hypothetical protein
MKCIEEMQILGRFFARTSTLFFPGQISPRSPHNHPQAISTQPLLVESCEPHSTPDARDADDGQDLRELQRLAMADWSPRPLEVFNQEEGK